MPIIGVPNPDDGDDAAKADFIGAMSTQISHVLDDPGELWLDYAVVSQPTMVFVAADGTRTTHTGALGPQKLVERLKEMAAAA